MKKLAYILPLFLLMLPLQSKAQQVPQFSQYMYNMISYNPAYAGSREFMVVNLLNRNQWVGVEGAPVTQTLSAHTGIPNSNVGVGMSFINDKLGYEQTTYAFADVSYRITLDRYERYSLTFGLKGGFKKYSLDDELLSDPSTDMDPFINEMNFKWQPNFGIGAYFRGENWYMGLSAPKLLIDDNNNEFLYIDRRSYFLNGGYLMDINPSLKFKPSFLLKYTDGAPLSLDLTTMFFMNENLWLGVSYRIKDAVGAIVNFKVANGLSVGYAYDYITSDLNASNYGSHELMLNYEFEFPAPRCRCPDLYN